MKQVDWKQVWTVLRTYVLNKYILTLIIFGIIFIFVGDQSLIKGLQRGRKIRQLERSLDKTNAAIDEATRQINALNHPDSLEKYAREKYLMHKDNEDIYLVDE